MKPFEMIKSFLDGSARNENSTSQPPTPPPLSRSGYRIVNALDAAVDASSETVRTNRPSEVASPQDRKNGPGLDEIEANKIRGEIRAETERMKQQTQLDAEKAGKEKLEAAERTRTASTRKASSWEELFKRYRPDDPVVISEPLVSVLIKRGGLRDAIAARAAEVKPHLDAWDVAFEARGKHTRVEFKRQLFADMEENEKRLQEGLSDLRKLPDEAAFEKQASQNREICKTAQRKAADAVNPVISEIADKLQTFSRELAVEIEKTERKTAFEFGFTFEPSCILRGVVSAGFELRNFVEHNWLCSHLTCPRTTLFGILDVNKEWR
jgi:hypothetical protein